MREMPKERVDDENDDEEAKNATLPYRQEVMALLQPPLPPRQKRGQTRMLTTQKIHPQTRDLRDT